MPASSEQGITGAETSRLRARGAKAAPGLSPYVSVAVQFATPLASIVTEQAPKLPKIGGSITRHSWHSTCFTGGAGHDLLLVSVEPSPGLMDMPPRRSGEG